MLPRSRKKNIYIYIRRALRSELYRRHENEINKQSLNVQRLPELRNRYARKNSDRTVHILSNPADIQTQTHWNLIGRVMTALRRMLSPSSILPPPWY